MIKEVGLGVGLALVIFLAFNGINLFPILLLGGIGYYFLKVLNKQGLGSNFSLRKKDRSMIPNVDFSDVGGQEAAKNELLEALDFVNSKEEMKKCPVKKEKRKEPKHKKEKKEW